MPILTITKNGLSKIQVRALLAIVFTIGVTAGFFMKLINSDQYMGMAGVVITYYFAKRQAQDENETFKPPNALTTSNVANTTSTTIITPDV